MQTPKIKSKVFKSMINTILEWKEQGYTMDQIVNKLAENGLTIKPSTYKTYLNRFAKSSNPSNKTDNTKPNVLNSQSNTVTPEKQELRKTTSQNHLVGTPEHKAEVLAESQDFLKNYQAPKTGLRGK